MSLTEKQIKESQEPVVWIARRDGAIYGIWHSPPDPEQDPGAAAVCESDPEVQAYRSRPLPVPSLRQRLGIVSDEDLKELKTLLAGK